MRKNYKRGTKKIIHLKSSLFNLSCCLNPQSQCQNITFIYTSTFMLGHKNMQKIMLEIVVRLLKERKEINNRPCYWHFLYWMQVEAIMYSFVMVISSIPGFIRLKSTKMFHSYPVHPVRKSIKRIRITRNLFCFSCQ